ncbi:MAG TPA: hypothetical protein VK694_02420 [Verrucomicrobiae bacterium]|nr:hypothetical protein [Verrucomicrobiae bacterium]
MEPQGPVQGPPPTPPQQPPEEQDEYAAASQSTADYIHNLEPVKAQKKKRKIKGIIFIALVVLVAIGAAMYFLVLRRQSTPSQGSGQPSAPQQQPVESVDEELSEHLVSQDIQMSIDHPKTWQKDDATQGQLTLQSPAAQITTSDGSKKSGKVLITIVTAGSTVPKFANPTGKAVVDSQKIAYAQPSQSQRKETYLSFAGFDGSTGVDAVYITGDAGYKKGQDIPKTDVAKSEPIIGVSFVKCDGGQECKEGIAIDPEAWGSDKILSVAQAILKSLVVQ